MRKPIVTFMIAIAAIAFLTLYRLDYYIVKPGHAYDVSEFIDSEQLYAHEGTLNLMTVAMQVATPLSYALSWFDTSSDIAKKTDVRRQDESDKEYEIRQEKQMADSQFNAKYVAYQKLGLKTKVQFEGLYIVHVVPKGAAEKYLQAGDEVIAVDGKEVTSLDSFSETIASKKENENVALTFIRQGKEHKVAIALKPIPNDAKGRTGLGVAYNAAQTIITEPAIELEASDIGGPSAGLMFTLGIMNALSEEDLTKGYDVAGSGTMNLDGTVGAIGEIGKKVIAAHRDGMAYFFALATPLDDAYKKAFPDAQTNYEEAQAMAQTIGTKMEIVPVSSIDDALAFLAQLPSK